MLYCQCWEKSPIRFDEVKEVKARFVFSKKLA